MKIIDDFESATPDHTIRLVLEIEPIYALKIAKALYAQATGTPVTFTEKEKQDLNATSQTIIRRYQEQDIDYIGQSYEIWARGKRRIVLGFRREPDMYLGRDIGRNFLEACNHFFNFVCFSDGQYNPKNNTVAGHILFTIDPASEHGK